MGTTEWFTLLRLEQRKAILQELHQLRRSLDASPEGRRATIGGGPPTTRADLVLGLVRTLDEDHHAVKDIKHVCEV